MADDRHPPYALLVGHHLWTVNRDNQRETLRLERIDHGSRGVELRLVRNGAVCADWFEPTDARAAATAEDLRRHYVSSGWVLADR